MPMERRPVNPDSDDFFERTREEDAGPWLASCCGGVPDRKLVFYPCGAVVFSRSQCSNSYQTHYTLTGAVPAGAERVEVFALSGSVFFPGMPPTVEGEYDILMDTAFRSDEEAIEARHTFEATDRGIRIWRRRDRLAAIRPRGVYM